MTTHEILELLIRRLDRQDEAMREIRDQLTDHLKTDTDLNQSLVEMADMWQRSKVVAWAITKLASFVAVGVASMAWIKDHGIFK